MARSSLPNYHSTRLVRELVRLRKRAGLTQAELAERLREFDGQKVSRLENGQLPTYYELCAMLVVFDVSVEELQRVHAMWERARADYWWDHAGPGDWMYAVMEHEASAIVDLQVDRLPDLLQSEAYASRLRETRVFPPDDERKAGDLTALAHRQRHFDTESTASLRCMVIQRALHTDVDEEQLHVLLDRSVSARVTILVVPESNRLRAIQSGSCTLLSFPDEDEPDFVYSTHSLGAYATRDVKLASMARRQLEAVEELAWTEVESLRYIKNLLGPNRMSNESSPQRSGRYGVSCF